MKSEKLRIACEEIVQRDVFVRLTATVELMLGHDPDYLDEMENQYRECCPECESTEYRNAEGEEDCEFVCESCGAQFVDLDSVANEIYEYWAVSPWLARKLLDAGEPVFDGDDCHIWGRCTTGQAISIDDVIERIAAAQLAREGET